MKCYYGIFVIHTLPSQVKKEIITGMKQAGFKERDRMGFRSKQDADKFLSDNLARFSHALEVGEYGYI